MTEDLQANIAAAVDRLNPEYFTVMVGGRLRIMYWEFSQVRGGVSYVPMASLTDFKNLYSNDKVLVGRRKKGDPIYETSAVLWLTSPRRRQYSGSVDFELKLDRYPVPEGD